MKSLISISSLFVVAGLANAQYFSAGWTPGQPVPTVSTVAAEAQSQAPQPTETAGKRGTTPKSSFLDNLITGGPLAALSSFINITGTPPAVWDERIPLITDSNYVDLIVNEKLTPEEEEQRVWFIVITSTAGQPEGVSKFVDESFDATYNYTLEKGDLEHVRFGRVDYLDVTAITTKWVVWSPPTLVVLKDRGKTLRFYRAGQFRLNAEVLYQFLKEEAWRRKEPWVSIYGPGGEREWVLDYLALAWAMVYSYLSRVPKWLMYILSGGMATFLLNFLHRPKAQEKSQAKPRTASKLPATPAAQAVTPKAGAKTTATSGQKTPSKRRGKNKDASS